jgi:hypothetical protein
MHCCAGTAAAAAVRRKLQSANSTSTLVPGIRRLPGGINLLTRYPPLWAQRDPAFKAAMANFGLLREEGQGVTAAQALASDRAARQAKTGGTVSAAAGTGTIAAWIYGDNGLVDSGGINGVVRLDEISHTAK